MRSALSIETWATRIAASIEASLQPVDGSAIFVIVFSLSVKPTLLITNLGYNAALHNPMLGFPAIGRQGLSRNAPFLLHDVSPRTLVTKLLQYNE
jgi:hypothetical protein